MTTLLYATPSPGLATITLNRPDVLNAINLEMRDELWETLHAAEADPDVRVVIFKGAGERAFSAGADISEFGTAPSVIEARNARRERDLWGYMLTMETVLIAAIHGYALGAGIELPMCCDIRIASDDAQIGLPEVGLGYIPSAGGTQTLPRHIPPGIAMQMIVTGDPIDAQTALRHGLVQRVVPRERLHAEAEVLAQRILAMPPDAVKLAKRAILEGVEMTLENGLALESTLAQRSLVAFARGSGFNVTRGGVGDNAG